MLFKRLPSSPLEWTRNPIDNYPVWNRFSSCVLSDGERNPNVVRASFMITVAKHNLKSKGQKCISFFNHKDTADYTSSCLNCLYGDGSMRKYRYIFFES